MAVLVRPWLWVTALRQLVALAPTAWWRRWPPLPLPDPDYLRCRRVTQYGDATRSPELADLLGYLRWCKNLRRVARSLG